MSLSDQLLLIQTACVVLAFLGLLVQLYHTERTGRANAYQSLVSQLQGLHGRLSRSPDSAAFKDALAPNIDASPSQLISALSLLNLLESAHLQHKLGVIPHDLWVGWEDQMSKYFKMTVFAEVWKVNRQAHNRRFRATMDQAEKRSCDRASAEYGNAR